MCPGWLMSGDARNRFARRILSNLKARCLLRQAWRNKQHARSRLAKADRSCIPAIALDRLLCFRRTIDAYSFGLLLGKRRIIRRRPRRFPARAGIAQDDPERAPG